MKTEDLTLVETTGDAIQCAAQLGEAVRPNFKTMAAFFEPHIGKLEAPAAKRAAERIRTCFLRECEDLLPCLDAFAENVGASRDEVLRINLAVAVGKSAPLPDECTGLVLKKEGRIVVGQNWDTGESSADMAVLEISRNPDGPNAVRFTSCLFPDFWAGVNPHGVATAGCSGPAGDPVGTVDGLGVMFWRMRAFYRCRSAPDVERAVEIVPLTGKGTNMVYVDPQGDILWVQHGGGRHGLYAPSTPYCAATGFRPLMDRPVTDKEKAEKNRWLRVMRLCADALADPRDPVEGVRDILCDYTIADCHPHSSPCRCDGPESSTQYSLVIDVTDRKLHYCGQPHDRRWRTVDFGK